MANTYIEQHYALSVLNYEGLWEMTFKNPYNKEESVSILIQAPNSNPDNTEKKDRPIATPGPRLTEVLQNLLLQIEAYPYSWDFSGKKIVSYGYDFESNFSESNITEIDLTEIAFKEVIDHYNFNSPLIEEIVEEEESISGKGVMVKFKITLNKPKQVNHLAIDFFTAFPMDLLSVMYQADTSKNTDLYEIPLQRAVRTNNTTYLHFSPVFARVFYLIIRQESYSLENQPLTKEQVAKNELWGQATENSKRIYETAAGEYMGEFFSSLSGVELHQEILDSYQNINTRPKSAETAGMNPYRQQFTEVKRKLDSTQR